MDLPQQLPQGLGRAGNLRLASFYYCSQPLPSYVKAAAMIIWLLLIISLRAATANNLFVPLLEELSENMGLSKEVAEVTLLSLANGIRTS